MFVSVTIYSNWFIAHMQVFLLTLVYEEGERDLWFALQESAHWDFRLMTIVYNPDLTPTLSSWEKSQGTVLSVSKGWDAGTAACWWMYIPCIDLKDGPLSGDWEALWDWSP